MIVMRET